MKTSMVGFLSAVCAIGVVATLAAPPASDAVQAHSTGSATAVPQNAALVAVPASQEKQASPGSSESLDASLNERVAAEFAVSGMAALTNVSIHSDETGAVWLSGKAPTDDASRLATKIAENTDGVVAVYNKINIAQ